MSSRSNVAHRPTHQAYRPVTLCASEDIAHAYDHAGDAYLRYADGEERDDPATTAVRSVHADTIVWQAICGAIDALCKDGVSSLRVLDAGCGPGTWLRRIALHAHRRGLGVQAVGFDISTGQLDIARRRADSLFARIADSNRPRLEFLEHDLLDELPWSKGEFHLVLCNFAVLNHLPVGRGEPRGDRHHHHGRPLAQADRPRHR